MIAGLTLESNPELIFCSHVDTVPRDSVGTGAASFRDGVLRGIGACDAKGSIVAMLFAYKELLSNKKVANQVAVVVLVGEEETGDGGLAFIKDRFKPRYAIVGEPTEMTAPWAQAGYVHLGLHSSCLPRHAFSERAR